MRVRRRVCAGACTYARACVPGQQVLIVLCTKRSKILTALREMLPPPPKFKAVSTLGTTAQTLYITLNLYVSYHYICITKYV